MKIKNTPPQLVATKFLTKLVRKAYGHGGVVYQKWPRKRPGPLHPTTQAQVVTWDAVQAFLPYIAALEFQAAMALTFGTAFYARDMEIMAAYGHHLSWPGWGDFPNGPPLPTPTA
jgi:hypothetical protein